MPTPSPAEILERRLTKEAVRQGSTVDALRERLLGQGLAQLEHDRAAIRQLEVARAAQEALRAQILIITATPTEKEALTDEVDRRELTLVPVKGQLTYKRIQGIHNRSILWMEVGVGPFRADGAATRCRVARAETGAASIMMVGTAFGLQSVHMGDVIVSDAVCMYDDRKVTQNLGNLVVLCRSSAYEASKFWVGRFREFATGVQGLGEYRVHVGTVLSGGAVVESALYRDALAERASTELGSAVVGGEMEAAGLLAGADNVDWVVVKGICDTADGLTRNDETALRDRQRTAARNAASALLGTLLLPEPSGQVIHG